MLRLIPAQIPSPHLSLLIYTPLPYHQITLKLCRCLNSSRAAQVPVKFQSQQTILNAYYSERGGIWNHRHLECLPNRLFRHTRKKTSKLHATGFCEGNPLVTHGFSSQRASNMENFSVWWHHHDSQGFWCFARPYDKRSLCDIVIAHRPEQQEGQTLIW